MKFCQFQNDELCNVAFLNSKESLIRIETVNTIRYCLNLKSLGFIYKKTFLSMHFGIEQNIFVLKTSNNLQLIALEIEMHLMRLKYYMNLVNAFVYLFATKSSFSNFYHISLSFGMAMELFIAASLNFNQMSHSFVLYPHSILPLPAPHTFPCRWKRVPFGIFSSLMENMSAFSIWNEKKRKKNL